MKLLAKIIILSLFFIQNGFSQEDIKTNEFLNFKIMPLSMIDHNPRFRFGLEFNSGNKLVYGLDMGIGNNFINKRRLHNMIWGQDYLLYEIRPEIKFLYINDRIFYLYNSAEFFYINMKDFLGSGHYQAENTSVETTFESANFSKQKYGVHLKGVINFIIAGRLNFDFYGGVGIAKRIITYTDVVNPIMGMEPIFVEWMPQEHLFEGESLIFQLPIGIKVGYTLLRK